MKCNNCGSILLVGTTVCPYCNTPQDNASNEQNVSPVDTQNVVTSPVVENSQVTPVITPITPDVTPVATPSVSDLGIATPAPEVAPTPVSEVAPVAAPIREVAQTALASSEPTFEEPTITSEVETVEGVTNVQPTPASDVAVPPMPGVSDGTSSAVMETQSIAPSPAPMAASTNNVEAPISGEKIANTAVQPVKKSGKKTTLIVAILIVIIGGLAALFYFYEFKSSDKRIDTIFNELTNTLTSNTVRDITKTSGRYSIDAKANVMGQEAKIALDGTYGVDIDNKIIDYTLNLSNLYLGENLIPEKLIAGIYINDDKLYFNVDNFYNKIVSMNFEQSDELFKNKGDEINTNLIIKSASNALRDGIKAMSNKQSIEDITLDGKKQKANVITINMNDANDYKFEKALYDSLINNELFLEEIAKISGVSVDEIKNHYITEPTEPSTMSDEVYSTIKIASPLVGNDLLGIVICNPEDANERIEIVSIDDGFKLVVKVEEVNINLDITSSNKKDGKVTITTSKIKGSAEISGQSVSVDVTVTLEEDNEPVINKKNVKNSVAVENIPAEDLQGIMEKVVNFGSIGNLLEQYLKPQYGENDNDDWDDMNTDNDYDFDSNWDISIN